LENQLSRMNCQIFFDRVEFGRLRRQRHQGDVGGNVELVGEVPAGLIEQENGMGSRRLSTPERRCIGGPE